MGFHETSYLMRPSHKLALMNQIFFHTIQQIALSAVLFTRYIIAIYLDIYENNCSELNMQDTY